MTPAEVASILGKGNKTVQDHLRNAGVTPVVVLGRMEGFALQDLQDLYRDMYAPLLTFLGYLEPVADENEV